MSFSVLEFAHIPTAWRWEMWSNPCHILRRHFDLLLLGQPALVWSDKLLSDLCQMEPVVLVGNLSYREFQAQDMELKLKEGEERLDSRYWGDGPVCLQRKVWLLKMIFQCELMRFVEGACMNWHMVGISWERGSWEGRWLEQYTHSVVGICLCGWQFGEGEDVTCKDQL